MCASLMIETDCHSAAVHFMPLLHAFFTPQILSCLEQTRQTTCNCSSSTRLPSTTTTSLPHHLPRQQTPTLTSRASACLPFTSRSCLALQAPSPSSPQWSGEKGWVDG